MATQGKLETNYVYGQSDKWYLRLNWNNPVQSTAENYTTIDWNVELVIVGTGTYVMGQDIHIFLGGTRYDVVTSSQKLYNGQIGYGKHTIYHNASGKGSFSASLHGSLYVLTSNNASASTTFYLNDIPRKATATSVQNFTDEDNPVLYYSNPAGEAVSALEACISFTGDGSVVGYRPIPKTGSSYTFNLTEAEREALRNGCDTSASRIVYFYVRSTIGGTQYASWASSTLTIKNAEPTVTFAAYDVNNTTLNLTGDKLSIIKGKSSIKLTMEAVAKKGASIAESAFFYNGSWLYTPAGASASATWANATNVDVRGWVKDTRKLAVYTDAALKLIPYFEPYCEVTAKATSVSGTTATININISGKYFNNSFGAKRNSVNVYYRYRQNNGTYGSWTSVATTSTGDNVKASANVKINYKNKISVQAKITDSLVSDVMSNTITVDPRPIFDWGKTDFNFNVPINMSGDENKIQTMTNLGVKDYVVYKYDHSYWHTIKFNSGTMIQWYHRSLKVANVDFVKWENHYWCDIPNPGNFPDKFTEIPAVFYNVPLDFGANVSSYTAQTTTHPGTIAITRPSGVKEPATQGYYEILAIGRWK